MIDEAAAGAAAATSAAPAAAAAVVAVAPVLEYLFRLENHYNQTF